MLAVQVQYWTLKENKRHNIETEKLGNRTLAETIRHNVVTEDETHRHNVATEEYYQNVLGETIRHNTTTEGLTARQLDIAQGNLEVAERNADTNLYAARVQATKVANDYALGTEANNIAAENMRISKIRADIAQQDADTAASKAQIEFLKWATGSGVDQQNAQSQAKQADTSARQAEISAGALELNKNRFQWQKFTDFMGIVNDQANTAIKGADTMTKFLTH